LLVGSVVIDAEVGRKNHGSIPAFAIGRELKLLDAITDLEPYSTGGSKKSICDTSKIK
jgi:hypothetical protein